jgi:hypothetical protein
MSKKRRIAADWLFGLDLVNCSILREQFRVDNSHFLIITHENLDDGTRQGSQDSHG